MNGIFYPSPMGFVLAGVPTKGSRTCERGEWQVLPKRLGTHGLELHLGGQGGNRLACPTARRQQGELKSDTRSLSDFGWRPSRTDSYSRLIGLPSREAAARKKRRPEGRLSLRGRYSSSA